MPIIRLADVPQIAETGPDVDTLVMKKAIGSRSRDPAFAMPDETPSLSIFKRFRYGITTVNDISLRHL